jgi:carbon storage regulator
MLVLTRRIGDAIQIGDDILIVVTDIRNDKVRLGIEAPKEVLVNRHEIVEEIARDGRGKPAMPLPKCAATYTLKGNAERYGGGKQ